MADTGTIASGPPVDLAFLDQYTGGDIEIRDQVLGMFIEQVDMLLGHLESAVGDAASWRQVSHSLKGCARGVGANAVADLARRGEQMADADPAVQRGLIGELRTNADTAVAFIRNAMK